MRPLVIESDNGVGDTLTFGSPDRGGDLEIQIDNPWSGDTETGFGRTASWHLTTDQARQVRDYLNAVLQAQTKEG